MVFVPAMTGQRRASDHKLPSWLHSARCGGYRDGDWDTIVGSKRLLPLAGCAYTGGFTLFATFVADRFRETPPKRYATENSFFEYLGLVGGFILVAWYDLQG